MNAVGNPQLRAHPRSRGENPRRDLQRHDNWGSSPLTRGKPDKGTKEPAHVRLIPAHAGKTLIASCSPAPIRAHPRSRGENLRYWSQGVLY